MDVMLECTEDSFLCQKGTQGVREISAAEWLQNRREWGIYSDWGPQEGDMDAIAAKGERIYVLLENGRAIAAAGRLPRPGAVEEIDSVWVTSARRGQGIGVAIVAHLTQLILADGKCAQYCAVNEASLRAAQKVGYRLSAQSG